MLACECRIPVVLLRVLDCVVLSCECVVCATVPVVRQVSVVGSMVRHVTGQCHQALGTSRPQKKLLDVQAMQALPEA